MIESKLISSYFVINSVYYFFADSWYREEPRDPSLTPKVPLVPKFYPLNDILRAYEWMNH